MSTSRAPLPRVTPSSKMAHYISARGVDGARWIIGRPAADAARLASMVARRPSRVAAHWGRLPLGLRRRPMTCGYRPFLVAPQHRVGGGRRRSRPRRRVPARGAALTPPIMSSVADGVRFVRGFRCAGNQTGLGSRRYMRAGRTHESQEMRAQALEPSNYLPAIVTCARALLVAASLLSARS
jgi:hypothetical protein